MASMRSHPKVPLPAVSNYIRPMPARTPRTLPAFAFAFAFAFASAVAFASAPLASGEKVTAVTLVPSEDRLRIEIGDELFTEYVHAGEERHFPLFYPVLGPGQIALTRGFPIEEVEGEDTDHPHHQSLWFAHSDINGETFWAVQTYRDRVPGRTVHQGFRLVESGERNGRFIAENAYVAADGRTVLTDEREVTVRAPAGPEGPRVLDIAITFHASHGEVVFGDEKDAGMAIRVARTLQQTGRTPESAAAATGRFTNSEGDEGEATWGKAARWAAVSGEVGGRQVGVALMDHGDNPRHPTWWHSRTYGLLAANAFGRHFFENLEDRQAGALVIPEGESATFRWRFVFHLGETDSEVLEPIFESFRDKN